MKWLFGKGRTFGTSDTCEYAGCREPGAGEARYHDLNARNGVPWTMCAEHVRPEYHPKDGREHLMRW